MNGSSGPTMFTHNVVVRPQRKPSVILRYDTVVSIVRRKATSAPAPSSSFKWSEVMRRSAPTEFLRTDPALYPLHASHRSEGVITSRWAITSLLILAVTSEVSPKAGWPNGTLEHPRHPPVSPTQLIFANFHIIMMTAYYFAGLSIFPLVVIIGPAFDFN